MTDLGGIFPNLRLPSQCKTRNPKDVTMPGKSRKKMVKLPVTLWPWSNKVFAFQIVVTLLKNPKMIPPKINSKLWKEYHFDPSVIFEVYFFIFSNVLKGFCVAAKFWKSFVYIVHFQLKKFTVPCSPCPCTYAQRSLLLNQRCFTGM